MNAPARIVPIQTDDIHGAVERTLAENLRLRGWLNRMSNVEGANTLERQFARRIRHMALRALRGDGV